METSKGELARAMAMGLILVGIALVASLVIVRLSREDDKSL